MLDIGSRARRRPAGLRVATEGHAFDIALKVFLSSCSMSIGLDGSVSRVCRSSDNYS